MPQIQIVSRAPRHSVFTTVLLALALVVGTQASAAPASALDQRYAGMPLPEEMATPSSELASDDGTYEATSYTLSNTMARFRAGRYYFFRFNTDTGTLLRKRSVYFATVTRYTAANSLRTFGGVNYVKITSGTYGGWFVRTNDLALASTAFSAPQGVQLAKGTHTGVRFYKNGRLTLRRSATLAAAATYTASQTAVFNDRVFFYLKDGPLANRWVARSSAVTLVQKSSSDTTAPTTKPSVTWKALLIVYRETDVTFTRSDGSSYRLRARINDSTYDLSRRIVSRFVSSASGWSDNFAAVSMKVVDAGVPLTKLDTLANGKYWVGPKSVRPELDKYAPTGAYDSVFILFQHKDSNGVLIPLGGWGLTLPPGSWSNGAGYSSVHVPTHTWWWTDTANPEEVFVHEWMHQVLFFHQAAGRTSLDLHAGAQYGYSAKDGSWKVWMSDVMRGLVKDGNKLLGVNYEMWRAGTPTRASGW